MKHKHVPIVQQDVIRIKLPWKRMVLNNARHAAKASLRIETVPKHVPNVQRVPFLWKMEQLQTSAQIAQKENTTPSLVTTHHACHAHLQTPQVQLSVVVVIRANTLLPLEVILVWSANLANTLIKEI